MRRNLRAIGTFFILTVTSFLVWSSVIKETQHKKTTILVNPSHYWFINDYVISPSRQFCQKNPFIIMIVTSYVGDIELRNLFRKAIPREYLESMNTSRIFLLAKAPPEFSVHTSTQPPLAMKNITQSMIEEENENFHDILQGSFMEHYRRLTIKHLMGLQWVAKHCQNATYILKLDDDTVFSFERIFTYLNQRTFKGDFILGYMLNDTKPVRDHSSRWQVSFGEYPGKVYPSYVSGWYYVTTPAVAEKLVHEANYHPYFWIDDVHITGTLVNALNIKLMQIPDEFWFEYTTNVMIHTNKDIWDITAYNNTLAIVKLARSSW